MNFLLNDEEKRAFYRAMRTVMQFDRHFCNEEQNIASTIREIFKLDSPPEIPSSDNDSTAEKERINQEIVKDINKIQSLTPVIYLFRILYDLEKFNKMENPGDFRQRINDILEQVDKKKEITSSKLYTSETFTVEKTLGDQMNSVTNTVKSFFGKMISSNVQSVSQVENKPKSVEGEIVDELASKIDIVHKKIKEEQKEK